MVEEGKDRLLVLIALIVTLCMSTTAMVLTSGVSWEIARAINVVVFILFIINLAQYLAYLTFKICDR